MAAVEHSTEGYKDHVQDEEVLLAWELGYHIWHVKQHVEAEDSALSCISTWPRSVDLFSSNVPNSIDRCKLWSWSPEVLLQHCAEDKSSHSTGEVLDSIEE